MQTEHWNEFEKEMRLLCEAYDRKQSSDLFDSYWQALNKMFLADFKAVAKYAREQAGKEGFFRLPMPGRFWAMKSELNNRQGEKSQITIKPMSHQEHLAHLRRIAIEVARREKMPKFKGCIVHWKFVPPHAQNEMKIKWEQWKSGEAKRPDDYWWPRARELMIKWGEKRADESLPGESWKRDVVNALPQLYLK